MRKGLVIAFLFFVYVFSSSKVSAADLQLIEQKVVETVKSRTQEAQVLEDIQENNEVKFEVNSDVQPEEKRLTSDKKTVHWSIFNDVIMVYTLQGQTYLHIF